MSPLRVVTLTFLLMLLFVENKASPQLIWTLIHDIAQTNFAGVPVIHERTEWNFDPEIGKIKRMQYEAENGRHGEIAIAKLGMGIGYKGPWGTPAKSDKTNR